MKNDFSFLIIENTENIKNDAVILDTLYSFKYEFIKESTLENCKLPGEDQISIGYYKNQIILCDRMELVNVILENSFDLTFEEEEEQRLVDVFPLSEILTVAYIEDYDFYGYSLIKEGIKKRIKLLVDSSNYVDVGAPLEEEIYNSQLREEERKVVANNEQQLIKQVIFTLIKNKLGIDLNKAEAFEFMNDVTFKTYEAIAADGSFSNISKEKSHSELIIPNKSRKWVSYIFVLILILILSYFLLLHK